MTDIEKAREAINYVADERYVNEETRAALLALCDEVESLRAEVVTLKVDLAECDADRAAARTEWMDVSDERDAVRVEVETLRADLARERGRFKEVNEHRNMLIDRLNSDILRDGSHAHVSPPTHADIDAHPDPVVAVERVTGMRWQTFEDMPGLSLVTPGEEDPLSALALTERDGSWSIWRSHTGDDLVERGESDADFPAQVTASRALLHALLDGRAKFPEGAPGWAAWSNEAPKGAGGEG